MRERQKDEIIRRNLVFIFIAISNLVWKLSKNMVCSKRKVCFLKGNLRKLYIGGAIFFFFFFVSGEAAGRREMKNELNEKKEGEQSFRTLQFFICNFPRNFHLSLFFLVPFREQKINAKHFFFKRKVFFSLFCIAFVRRSDGRKRQKSPTIKCM